MFSSINKLYTTPTRHAEETDTHEYIRKHDPDDPRGNDDEDSTKKEDLFTSDDRVSINTHALLAFLKNFLTSLKSDEKDGGAHKGADSIDVKPAARAIHGSNPNAKAARAYQSSARAQGSSMTQPPGAGTEMKAQDAQNLLGSEDIRTIYTLIEDVQSLITRQIQFIEVEKSSSFLQGLVLGVQNAK